MPRGGHGGLTIGEAGGHGSNTSGNHTGERSSFSTRGIGDGRGGKSAFHTGDRERTRDRDREMVGGCCVCSDERGWDENPLVYCDGHGCNVAVHQACYGIVSVPTGPWFCRKCESQERAARVRCELCPNKDGGLKRTDTNSWAHVVCALYIPEVRFGNVSTMEPIVLGLVPQERYLKVCYLCEAQGRESRASSGACMQCNKSGCKQSFHVTCAQRAGLLCEEAGNYMDNVKYCGYCEYHYSRINKKFVKAVPAYRPTSSSNSVFDRVSDDEKNSPRSTSSPDHKRLNLDSEFVNSTSRPSTTKSINNTSAALTCSTSGLNSSLVGSAPSISVTEGKGDRGGGDSSSVVSSSSSSSKKGKKGRKPNSEKGSSGSNDGKLEPSKLSLESSNVVDASSTTSGLQKSENGEGIDGKVELNANKTSITISNAGASTSSNKTNDSPSLTTQNSKDLSTSLSMHGNSQDSTSTHTNQLKEDATRRPSPSTAASGISNKPTSEATNESSNNIISTSSTNTKPPSVIVKFGKQDGTYYSKKDPTPSLSSVSMSSSSSSATTNSSSTLSSSGSANNMKANDNASSSVSGNRPSASNSQHHSHRDHRHGKKHTSWLSKGSQKDSSISTTDSSNGTSNNGLDAIVPKVVEGNEPNCSVNKTGLAVDFTTVKQEDPKLSSQSTTQNEKGVVDGNADPYNKGFTNANFIESVVTPTSSVGAALFGKEPVPRSQQHHTSGSMHHDKEPNPSRVHSSHSTDRRHPNQSSHRSSSFSNAKHDVGSSVSTSLIKNEPLDFVKKDTNNDLSITASSSSATVASHKSFPHDKPNVDLKLTKFGAGDNSTGKPSQVYGSYNKHPYETSSLRGEKLSSSSVTVSKSTHHVTEPKKDSPAKILPISASSTSPEKTGMNSGSSSASFGRPLKVEVSSASASRSSSLEVSPVKRTDDVRMELSPSKLSKEIGPKVPSKASGKRLGRPPKKGTHLKVNSLGHLATSPPVNATSTEASSRKRSPQSSPERDSGDYKKRRKRSPSKRLTNGQRDSNDHNSRDRLWMMMGASLNPSSSMSEELDSVLKHEVQLHSVYETSMQTTYHQVPLPGGKRSHTTKTSTSPATTNANSQDVKPSANKDQPQTLDELLERQWEQGSQFLMEQASHFDIASLLSSLHQLKEENLDLEDSVDRMVQRRDHLLAVRARLLALSSLTVATPNNSGSQTGGNGTPTGVGSNQTTPERERYTAVVAHQTGQSTMGGTTVVNVGTSNGPSPSSGRSSTHVSPRNSAATISPIRTGGSGAAIISPRAPQNLPPPPSSQVQIPTSVERSHNLAHSSSNSTSASIYMQPPPAHSPRDRVNSRPSSGGPLGIGPPPSHQIHGAPSPRDRGQGATSSPRHIQGGMIPSPHSRDSRLSPRIPSSTTVIHSGSSAHGTMPLENGVDYPHGGPPPGAFAPPPHGAIPISSPSPNLPPGTMIHPRNSGSAHNIPPGHGDLGPPLPRSSGPVSSAHLLSVASHPPSGRGVSINTTSSSGPPMGGGVVYTTHALQQPTPSATYSGPPPRQSSVSYTTASGGMPGGLHGHPQAHMPPRSSPHHPPPPGAIIHASQRGVPPHIPSSLGGGATTIMTAVSSSIGPPHSSGLPPVPPRGTGGMMIRPMGGHVGPSGSSCSVGTSYRPGAPPRNYHTISAGPHGPPPQGHVGVPNRSPTPINSQQPNMRLPQGRMMGPTGGMMNIHPQDKR